MTRSYQSTAKVGLAFILGSATWFGSWSVWYESRNWAPVDLPISLAKGHIRTPEFEIKVHSFYRIHLVSNMEALYQRANSHRFPLISWTLSSNGKALANGNNDVPYPTQLGGFEASRGRYVLDLEVSNDNSDPGLQPYLVAYEAGGWQEATAEHLNWAIVLFGILSPIGFSCLVYAVFVRRQELRDAKTRAVSLTWPGPLPWSLFLTRQSTTTGVSGYYPKLPKRLEIRQQRGSSFGLIAFLTYLSIFFMVWTRIIGPQIEYPTRGLQVRLLRPVVVSHRVPGIQPVLVHVGFTGWRTPPTLNVNSQPVPWENLETVLKKELMLRPPNWPVYLEGDRDIEWRSAVVVIDTVRGLRGEVILLTRPNH